MSGVLGCCVWLISCVVQRLVQTRANTADTATCKATAKQVVIEAMAGRAKVSARITVTTTFTGHSFVLLGRPQSVTFGSNFHWTFFHSDASYRFLLHQQAVRLGYAIV